VTFAAPNSVKIDDSLCAVGTDDDFLVENFTLSDDWRLSDLKRPGRDEYGTYCVLGSKKDEFDTGPQVILATDRESPLMNRAWVMQEYLLAPRTIHFAYPVVWECREMTIKRMFSRLYTFPSNPTPKVWTTGLERKDCFILWNQTVMKYSKCSLSEPNDKLVAIGGLARTFASVMKTEYVAGLWVRYLVNGLLWETMRNSTPVKHYRGECPIGSPAHCLTS
jgi:hypothetical protein